LGIELQALDTTGSVWDTRQNFLHGKGIVDEYISSTRNYGINWKMTAKTTLVQLHHKISSFESISKHLVLVLQDQLINYMKSEFDFSCFESAKIGNLMHFHSYELVSNNLGLSIELSERLSTDSVGIAKCLGLQKSQNMEYEYLVKKIQKRISEKTLLKIKE
jgi:Restriction endonuclease NotI